MAVGEHVSEEAPDELLSFAPLEDGNGLEIVDHIERRHVPVNTREPVSPKESTTDRFQFPVRKAITIQTDHISFPQQVGMIVRNSLGFMVAEVTKGEPRSFPRDSYSLDPGAPIKVYLEFDAAFDADVSTSGIQIDLDERAEVQIGARSHHKQPAATITTTTEIADVMEAVSYFSSALKTTSCERSYPTLRGHPPTLAIGDELSIPSVLTRPDTGITLELTEDYQSVYVCASLAYYLGAKIVTGDEPKLVTDQGFEHPLETPAVGMEERVERILKQLFFLDCITRTEGFFQVNLHERNAIEDDIDLDFSVLYDEPIAKQIETYLQVPYRKVSPQFPKWKLTSLVTPEPKYLETLPFLVNDLSVIKTVDETAPRRARETPHPLNEFVRRPSRASFVRAATEPAPTPSTVPVDEEDSMEQAWLGDGAPLGASKAMIEAFYNRLERAPSDSDIDITVVCNAAEMGQERDIVDEVYASRDELPFDVSIHRELTTEEMANVLMEDVDFLHYIGHIDSGGFECSDGRLDVTELEYTGVDVFFLNACSSYEQGMGMIRAGSIAGVVTLEDVINSGAERVGMTLARLLNWGFPLRPAMNIARNESIMGGHYLVLGDGSVDIAQPEIGIQGVCNLNQRGTSWGLKFTSFPTKDKGIGSIISPHLDRCDEFFLMSGTIGEFTLGEDELVDFLSVEKMPVNYDGKLTWSNELLKIGF